MPTHILPHRKPHDEWKLPMDAARGEFIAMVLALIALGAIAYSFWFEAMRW